MMRLLPSLSIQLFLLFAVAFTNMSTAQTNLVVNGNFAQAHACPQNGFTSDYSCDLSPSIDGPGSFAVTNNAGTWNGPWYGTSRTADGTNFLIADGGFGAGTRVWIQSVNVVNGQQYAFSAYVKNIVNPGSGAGVDQALPTVSLRVNGTEIATSVELSQGATNAWTLVTGVYSATSTGSVSLDVLQNMVTYSYNDIAVDDISFTFTGTTSLFSSEKKGHWEILAVPNPFNYETSISMTTAAPQEIVAEIFSGSGILLSTKSFMPTEKLSLGTELNTGMYFIKLSQNGVSETVKIVKQ